MCKLSCVKIIFWAFWDMHTRCVQGLLSISYWSIIDARVEDDLNEKTARFSLARNVFTLKLRTDVIQNSHSHRLSSSAAFVHNFSSGTSCRSLSTRRSFRHVNTVHFKFISFQYIINLLYNI